MPDTALSKTLHPAVLRFRGLDLEAMTALQMRSIDTMRRMVNLMLDNAETITQRQAAFLKAGVERTGSAAEPTPDLSDMTAVFERQAEVYRELIGALATHLDEIAAITNKCCAGMIREASAGVLELSAPQAPAERPAKGAAAGAKAGRR